MKVAIFGAGTMGSGIAQVFAAKGHTALMYASSVASAQKHKDKLSASLDKLVGRGKMTQEAKDAIMNNILVEEKSAAADADLVIECVKEDMATKKELLRELDAMCKPETIFASNTSSLSITEMANGLNHPVIGMHFFNPVPMMKLVEVIRGANTSQETFECIYKLSEEIGKTPVEVAEAPGFVVNKILIPMINEAIGLLETGVASAEDIDTAMKLGANHPMGPLALGDLVGLDVCLAIMNTLYTETGDPKYRPAGLLKKYVRAGWLGRKSGRGIFNYSK
ncbi:MAG: NAD(P)-binding domain-containing protein [Oscillibacter sp.]|nr:NAD(P)-binding domain-containing protein [Oscillibacter sp.]